MGGAQLWTALLNEAGVTQAAENLENSLGIESSPEAFSAWAQARLTKMNWRHVWEALAAGGSTLGTAGLLVSRICLGSPSCLGNETRRLLQTFIE